MRPINNFCCLSEISNYPQCILFDSHCFILAAVEIHNSGNILSICLEKSRRYCVRDTRFPECREIVVAPHILHCRLELNIRTINLLTTMVQTSCAGNRSRLFPRPTDRILADVIASTLLLFVFIILRLVPIFPLALPFDTTCFVDLLRILV